MNSLEPAVPVIGRAGLRELFTTVLGIGPRVNFRPPYTPTERFVLIIVDVEAMENELHRVSEIGIATLDSDDLIGIEPGDRGFAYMRKMKVKHYRVEENSYQNSERVQGNQERFLFGRSDFVFVRDAARTIQQYIDEVVGEPGSSYSATRPSTSAVTHQPRSSTTNEADTADHQQKLENDEDDWQVVTGKHRKSKGRGNADHRPVTRGESARAIAGWGETTSNAIPADHPYWDGESYPLSILPKPVHGLNVAQGAHDGRRDRVWMDSLSMSWPFRGVTAEFDNQQIARHYTDRRHTGAASWHKQLGIPTYMEHNGGNDAAFELCATIAITMMTDEQLDLLYRGVPLSKLKPLWPRDWKSIEQPTPEWWKERQGQREANRKKGRKQRTVKKRNAKKKTGAAKGPVS